MDVVTAMGFLNKHQNNTSIGHYTCQSRALDIKMRGTGVRKSFECENVFRFVTIFQKVKKRSHYDF